MSDPNVIKQPEAAPVVACSDWLAAINRQLDERVKDMKEQFNKCETPSQKNALGTAIITVNAIAWALNDARKEMAANAGTQRPGTSDAEPATRTPMPGSLE